MITPQAKIGRDGVTLESSSVEGGAILDASGYLYWRQVLLSRCDRTTALLSTVAVLVLMSWLRVAYVYDLCF